MLDARIYSELTTQVRRKHGIIKGCVNEEYKFCTCDTCMSYCPWPLGVYKDAKSTGGLSKSFFAFPHVKPTAGTAFSTFLHLQQAVDGIRHFSWYSTAKEMLESMLIWSPWLNWVSLLFFSKVRQLHPHSSMLLTFCLRFRMPTSSWALEAHSF